MKKNFLYFLLSLNVFFFIKINAQIAPPELRCVSVTSPTSAILSWVIPPDPTNVFTEYQIWSSATQLGTYTQIGTVTTYTQTTFTHSPSNVGLQSQYYYVKTISGLNSSISSDTLRSVYLNVSGGNIGIASLNWNALKLPQLPTSSLSYTVSREAPAGVWASLYIGNKFNFKDTITFACKIFYNYKVEISDASGCVSSSNIKGDTCYNLQPAPEILIDSVSVDANGNVVIGWHPSSSSDVDKYIIYKSNGGFLTFIDTVYGINNTSFTYTLSSANSSSEGYCVVAADACGNLSVPSVTHKSIFLTKSYDLCSRTASLSWTPYVNLPLGILKYDVYCSVNGGVFNFIGSSTGTSFTHSGLIPGDNYNYRIRVWNTDASISASSNSSALTAVGLPAPGYVYLNSVNVNSNNKQVELIYTVDNSNSYKGCNIYKSEDGINFTKIGYVVSNTVNPKYFSDNSVKATEKNYFYKIQISDDCDNPGAVSNISKTILLKAENDKENIFNNILTWDDYTTWYGGVESFNIYRSVNGVFDPIPIGNVLFGEKMYIDNVQAFVANRGKFSYYVEAVEGMGNTLGFKDKATSNSADAYVEVNVFVPNAFAPRGINNVWLPIAQYVEKTDYTVRVFNRWGDKIFETHSDTEGWTGDAATDEVYVYVIEYKNARGEYIQLKGHLNIIR